MIYDSFSDVGESQVWFASASDLFFGLFWVISEVRSQIYIANLAIFKIRVFSAIFRHEITLYAIDIDKKRFRIPFFNTLEPL